MYLRCLISKYITLPGWLFLTSGLIAGVRGWQQGYVPCSSRYASPCCQKDVFLLGTFCLMLGIKKKNSESLKSLLLYRNLCLYSSFTQCLCEVIQPSNFQVQKAGSTNTFFVSVCLEQTLGMTGILLKYFSCCTTLTPSPPFIFPVYRSWFLSRTISCSFLNFFSFGNCFLCHDLWRFFPRDYTDQVLPSDSILITWIKYKELLQSHCYCTTFIFLYHLLLCSVIYQG